MAILPLRSIGQRTSGITGLAIFSLLSGIIGIVVGLVAGGDILLLSLPLDVVTRPFIVSFSAALIGIAEIGIAIGLFRMNRSAWVGAIVVATLALAYSPLALAVTLHLLLSNTLANVVSNGIFTTLLLWQFVFALWGSIIVLEVITRAPQRVAFGRFRPSDFIPET